LELAETKKASAESLTPIDKNKLVQRSFYESGNAQKKEEKEHEKY
jgi:hypothetical protein